MKTKNEVSAGGMVFQKEKNTILWLVTQHSQHKGWGFPKGLVGDTVAEEAKEDAALREVEEEGGVQARILPVDPVQTSYSYTFQDTVVHKKVWYYLMEYISGDPKDHDWEVSEAVFLPAKEVLSTLTFPEDVEAFKQMQEAFVGLSL